MRLAVSAVIVALGYVAHGVAEVVGDPIPGAARGTVLRRGDGAWRMPGRRRVERAWRMHGRQVLHPPSSPGLLRPVRRPVRRRVEAAASKGGPWRMPGLRRVEGALHMPGRRRVEGAWRMPGRRRVEGAWRMHGLRRHEMMSFAARPRSLACAELGLVRAVAAAVAVVALTHAIAEDGVRGQGRGRLSVVVSA